MHLLLIPPAQLTVKMKELNVGLGVVVTAKGEQEDFVSRYFAPELNVNEDPVTGSSHSSLIPFWAERLGKQNMIARQLSERGGILYCQNAGERVKIGGGDGDRGKVED